jgi:hypothetical protein
VLPGEQAGAERLARLAEKLPSVGRNVREESVYAHVRAITCLRAGRYTDAIRDSEHSMKVDPTSWVQAQNRLLRALANHHQGNREEARKAWDRARGWMDGEKKRIVPGRTTPSAYRWADWLWLELLRAETAGALGE